MSQSPIPPELIRVIVQNLHSKDDLTTLSAVALTNYLFANIVREHRFKDITIGSADRCKSLLNLVEAQPLLGPHILSLILQYGELNWLANWDSRLPHVLRYLTAVKSLELSFLGDVPKPVPPTVLADLFAIATLTTFRLMDTGICGVGLGKLMQYRNLRHLSLERLKITEWPWSEGKVAGGLHLDQLQTLFLSERQGISAYGVFDLNRLFAKSPLQEYRLVVSNDRTRPRTEELIPAFTGWSTLRMINMSLVLLGDDVSWLLPIVEGLASVAQLQTLKLTFLPFIRRPLFGIPTVPPSAVTRALAEAREFWEKLDKLSGLPSLRDVRLTFRGVLRGLPEYAEDRLRQNIPSLVSKDGIRVTISWCT